MNNKKTYCDVCIFYSEKLTIIHIKKEVAGMTYITDFYLCDDCRRQIEQGLVADV